MLLRQLSTSARCMVQGARCFHRSARTFQQNVPQQAQQGSQKSFGGGVETNFIKSWEETGLNVITSYSTKGFTVSGHKLLGSTALFSNNRFVWKVDKFEDITEESLSLFLLMEPNLELLVLGVGDYPHKLPKELTHKLALRNVKLEVLDTKNACSTYNYLVSEGRVVAAGLIPPTKLTNPKIGFTRSGE
eukprot:Colp12_sorted_trinity150504_noHs@10284